MLLLALLGGCGPRSESRGYLPPRPTIVEVVEHERSYRISPRQLPAGRTVLQVMNRSSLKHDLSLVAVPEDMPPIAQQLRSPDRRAIATMARLPSREPGSTDAFAVDLPPGRYALLCFEKDGTGTPHARLGMAAEFRVVSTAETGGGRG